MNDEQMVGLIHDQLLNEYLSGRRPRNHACSWCGRNLLEDDYYYDLGGGEAVCEHCITRRPTEDLNGGE